MFVKNNFELGFVNGTLGIVERCDHNVIVVKTISGKKIDVPLASWVIEEDGKIKAEINQYPLRLAWAITIHKSQGMSLDYAVIDLSRSFEPGMGYVALSRLRQLSGLFLLGLNDIALQINPEILEVDRVFFEQSGEQVSMLRRYHPATIKEKQHDWLEKIAPAKSGQKVKSKKVSTIDETKEMIEQGKSLREIIELRKLTAGTILGHCEDIREMSPHFNFQSFVRNSKISQVRQLKIRLALSRQGMVGGQYPLNPAKDALGSGFSYEEIRLVRLLM